MKTLTKSLTRHKTQRRIIDQDGHAFTRAITPVANKVSLVLGQKMYGLGLAL